MSKGRIAVVIIGALIGLFAVGLIIGGAGLVWANETQRDADGFFSTDEFTLSTGSYAVTSADVDLGAQPATEAPIKGRGATRSAAPTMRATLNDPSVKKMSRAPDTLGRRSVARGVSGPADG